MLEMIREQEVLGKSFRVYGTWENPLFLAKDVAEWIGYDASSVHKLVKGADEEERVRNNVPTNGGEQEMWLLTEQGLYEVLMQSRKKIAKEFRKEVKAILKEIRLTGSFMANSTLEEKEAVLFNVDNILRLAEGWKEEQKKNQLLQEENKTMELYIEDVKPKVEFAEAVEGAENTISVGEMAKIISQNGVDMGQQRFYVWLRENGYVTKREGAGINIPTQLAMEMGLFKVDEKVKSKKNGAIKVSKSARVTGKGQLYFIKKLLPPKKNKCLVLHNT